MVLDWVMPGVSGVDVCRFLRSSSGPEQKIAILLLTSQRRTEQIVEGLAAGANDFLSKPFEDEELRARVGSLVRSRKLLERAEQAESLNRRLLESTPDPLITVDRDGRLTFANRAALQILDKRKSVLGADVFSVIPGLPFSAELRTRAEDAKGPLPDVEIGGRIYSPTVNALSADERNSTTVSLRDVTDRRRADARRLDFYSIVAHDLRSPLSAVMMRTDLMLRGVHGPLPPRVTTDLRRIDENLKSLLSMINDFLELARLEETGIKADRKEVRIDELLHRTMDDLQPLLEASDLRWEKTAAPEVVVNADQRRIAQVVANLVGNAIKFTPRHGVITTRLIADEQGVEVSVADNGRGIAPAALPHLFDRYTRANGAEPDIVGSGLGLMIVREVIEAHGGTVGVESTLGEGSRFWFRLPY